MKLKKIIYLLTAIVVVFLINSCKDDELPAMSKTVLKTNGPDYAVIQGRIYLSGSSDIIKCGVCWSVKSTPVNDVDLLEFPLLEDAATDCMIFETNDPRLVKVRIENLQPDTVYYARLFAQNKEGINYSYPARINTPKIPEGFIFVEAFEFEFDMGSFTGAIDEMPVHMINFEHNFFIQQKEVTVEEYVEFLNETEVKATGILNGKKLMDIASPDLPVIYNDVEYTAKAGMDKMPMTCVTWDGATEYANYVGGRLPTEAEWEYVAKGGSKQENFKYAGSDNATDCGWFISNSGSKLHEGGLKKANSLHIFDMSGNVLEWCKDWYGREYYGESPEKNPEGPKSGTTKVLRGGSFDEAPVPVTTRFFLEPTEARKNIGFRVVL